MMSPCDVERAGTIELYFYDELDEPERRRVQLHLTRCAACREALHDLGAIRAALRSVDQIAPPGGDWSAFMARLESAVHHGPGAPLGQPTSRPRLLPSLHRTLTIGFATAAALALVTVTVLWVFGSAGPPGSTPSPTAAASASSSHRAVSAPDPVLAAMSGQHFARSKVVVLDLATRDTSTDDAADWSVERDLASSLLSDTRLYRIAAEDRGMTSVAGMMRDLELVLLEASMTGEPDRNGLEQVQRLIRRRDLVTKMYAASVDVLD